MKTFIAVIPLVFLFVSSAHAQCSAESLVGLGINPSAAHAIGCDSLKGDLTPRTDDTYSLGTSSAEWKDAYIDGTLNADTASIGVCSLTGATTVTGSVDAGGASAFEIPNVAVASKPATCAVGELLVITDSDDCTNGSGDGALCVCKSANTWALVADF